MRGERVVESIDVNRGLFSREIEWQLRVHACVSV